jgi:hypothetical protein
MSDRLGIEDEPPQTPAPAPTWPVTEAHRRKAAEIGAWAIDEAHAYARGYHAAMAGSRIPDANREASSVAAWLEIAERADRLSRIWVQP